MSRLDVYPTPGRTGRGYVVDVQAPLLETLTTRVVVPLMPASSAPPKIKDLNPIFDIHGEPHVMVTQSIATVLLRDLRKPEHSLMAHHDEVTRALDILPTGYGRPAPKPVDTAPPFA